MQSRAMHTPSRRVLFPFLFLAISLQASAWGVLGHRIVGQIADAYLTPKAKAEIKKILGSESVAMSSNWADFIKSDSTYDYLNTWHYINLPAGLTNAQLQTYLRKDTATDVYTQMNFLVAELKKGTLPLTTKRMYLRLLIHFVGDVHQPFHVGRRDDRGGNGVRVAWFNTPTNLHAVWDESLVNFQQLSYTEYAAAINFPALGQVKQWQSHSTAQWIIESYAIVEKLYPEITDPNQRLSYEYNFKHLATLNDRLLKGGVRLAGLLNSIFGGNA